MGGEDVRPPSSEGYLGLLRHPGGGVSPQPTSMGPKKLHISSEGTGKVTFCALGINTDSKTCSWH